MKMTMLAALAAFVVAPAAAETVTATAADGTTVYGEASYAALPDTAPIIALFHQAGSNGRGEYGPLIPWLNGLGYRVIAFDQRSGGDYLGAENRTTTHAKGRKGFCDAYPDLEAGLAFAHAAAKGAKLVVWGSSYSASLIWRLAADHPQDVDAVVAMSTATGGELDRCGARANLPRLADKGLAVWPDAEEGQAQALRSLLDAKKVKVIIVPQGVHGSSTLVDARTHHNMSAARQQVADWLAATVK